jgi:hypothetical protein
MGKKPIWFLVLANPVRFTIDKMIFYIDLSML